MNFITRAGAIVTIAAIGVIGTAGATSAATSVTYTGQGFSAAGVLNTDDRTLETDTTKVGYLLWVLPANGATSATLHLPGSVDLAMTGKGGNFKVESEYFPLDALKGAFATYEGAVKGKVVLTVSHGHAPADTNIPSNTVDMATVTGDIPKGELPDNATFTVLQTLRNDQSWTASDDSTQHYYMDVTQRWSVKSTPILGNETGKIVGWHLDGVDKYLAYVGGGRSGAPYVGWTPDGTTFTGFLTTVFSSWYSDLQPAA